MPKAPEAGGNSATIQAQQSDHRINALSSMCPPRYPHSDHRRRKQPGPRQQHSQKCRRNTHPYRREGREQLPLGGKGQGLTVPKSEREGAGEPAEERARQPGDVLGRTGRTAGTQPGRCHLHLRHSPPHWALAFSSQQDAESLTERKMSVY